MTAADAPLSPADRARIDDLMSRMTVEEKLGQLNLLTADLAVTGPSVRGDYVEEIRKGRVGGLFNAYGREFTREMQRLAVEETRLGVPLLFAFDVIHGHRTIFPIPLGEAASWDLDLMERTARLAAAEAAGEGLHWTFAPMLDVCRDPRWGRIVEGPGESAFLGMQIARAKVRGYQGGDLAAPDTLAATAKHIGAYGAPRAGRDYETADISERTLREVYLPPFRAAVAAGVASIMPSFNDLAGVPATANEALLDGIVRGEWGFGGLFVSDYEAVEELVAHSIAADEADAARQALAAGLDMDMQSATFIAHFGDGVRDGTVPLARIDAAVRRVLELKARLGLFDDPYRRCREPATPLADLAEAARDAARHSIVLLRNEGEALPLRRGDGGGTLRTLAVIGPLADAGREMLGSWAGAGDPEKAVAILAGIEAATAGSGTRVLHATGCPIEGAEGEDIAGAVTLARQADAIVLCLGEAAWMSGEAACRSSLDLPGSQQALAGAVLDVAAGRGVPVIAVLTSGRPLALPWLEARASAILQTWFLGSQAGHAIADVLFGEWNPSGRLPVTVPRSLGQVPIHHDQRPTGRPPSDNWYSSKYLDVPTEPLYPFGFGLSYTRFRYDALRLSADSLAIGDAAAGIEVVVEVTNAGPCDGEETVQLYIRDLVASVARPVRDLRGFAKLRLASGESGTATFRLMLDDFAFIRRDMTFGPEPGDFEIAAGPNVADLPLRARFRLDAAAQS
jgi:beta-glucosidase